MSRQRRDIRSLSLAMLLSAFAGACYKTSPPLSRDPLATSPRGVSGRVTAMVGPYRGELLLIDAGAYTLLTSDRVVVILFPAAFGAEFPVTGLLPAGKPVSTQFDRLRYASRFPYGMPGSALRAILDQKKQTAPDTVDKRTP